MNKKVLGLGLSFATLALAMGTFGTAHKVSKAYEGDPFENLPDAENAVNEPGSYLANIWTNSTGSRRLDDRAVIANSLYGWGQRAQIPERTFDIGSFNISLDLSHVPNKSALVLIFGSRAGSYPSDDGKLVTFDIVRARDTSSTLWMITCSTGTRDKITNHNESIPSFCGDEKWEDDSNYVGQQVSSPDGIINIGVKKHDTTSTITVNEKTVEVQNEELFARCVDSDNGYFAIGGMNSSSYVPYVIKSIGDKTDDIYFGAEGAFTVCKAGFSALASYDFASASVDTVLEKKNEFDALPYADLYSWDKTWLGDSYNAAKSNVDAAVAAAGVTINLRMLATAVENLETATSSLTTVAQCDDALTAKGACDELIATLNGQTVEGEELDQFNALKSRYTTAAGKILPALSSVYDAAISAFENFIEDVASASEILAANNLKNQIPTHYNNYLDEETINAYSLRITAAQTALDTKTTLEHDAWQQNPTARVITTQNKTLDVLSYGGQGTSGLYNKNFIGVYDFQVKFNISRIGGGSGSWITLGLMEHCDMWINAETDEVQNNKGIFFLLNRMNSEQIAVQAFLCSLTSNRFYDSPLTQTINIPFAEDIELKFTEIEKTIAGVTDTYFQISFNDVTFDQETIASRKVKTIFTDKNARGGYFIMASSGATATDPSMIEIKEVCGKSPLESTAPIDAPTASVTSNTMTEGDTNDVTYVVDTKGQDITTITMGNAVLTTNDYTYDGTNLVIKGDAVKGLAAGDYTITVTTAGGFVELTLKVNAKGSPSDSSTEDVSSNTPVDTSSEGGNSQSEGKGGCGGSILATSGLISVLSVLGFVLVAKKRKEN